MRPPCSLVFIALTLFAVAASPALAGNGSNAVIYTWVDAQGVRHYSDHPGSPNARLLSFTASGRSLTETAASPATSEIPAARRPPGAPAAAAAATLNPAARAALCTKLRAEVKRLQSARRLRVNENGTNHYLSGDDLVAFKRAMKLKMQRTCTPPH